MNLFKFNSSGEYFGQKLETFAYLLGRTATQKH